MRGCPLWVKSGHQARASACPLSAGNQTSASGPITSCRGTGLDFLRCGKPLLPRPNTRQPSPHRRLPRGYGHIHSCAIWMEMWSAVALTFAASLRQATKTFVQ